MVTQQLPRALPRISVNKLAEYMIATPSRRRGIIRDQKLPLDFIVARYSDIYRPITDSLVAGGDVSPIRKCLKKLYEAAPKTVWQAQDMQLSVNALEAFLDLVDDIDLTAFKVIPANGTAPGLKIRGVDVSVRPELLLCDHRGAIAGAVKLCISKTRPLDAETAAYAGTVVHHFVADVVAKHAAVDPKQCYVIDVFAGGIHTGPKNFKRRRADIVAACEEIADRWPAF